MIYQVAIKKAKEILPTSVGVVNVPRSGGGSAPVV
jgi:hypothetical protein